MIEEIAGGIAGELIEIVGIAVALGIITKRQRKVEKKVVDDSAERGRIISLGKPRNAVNASLAHRSFTIE